MQNYHYLNGKGSECKNRHMDGQNKVD